MASPNFVVVHAPWRRLCGLPSKLLAALALATMLVVVPTDAVANRRARKAERIERVRWPVSLQPQTLSAWMRAIVWELVDLQGWSHLFVAASQSEPRIALGQSVGKPYRGALVDADELPDHPSYFRRHPKRIWGTASTVTHVQAAIASVHERYPHLHRLAVGDLSARHGGTLGGHRSHQSGRDVDLGFYFRQRPWTYPLKFADPTARNLHFRATWALIEALAATADDPDGVDYILLDYGVQRLLYMWAIQQDDGTRETLERILQYPRGKRAEVGIVRHYPKHANHLHVRFKCPPSDALCI